MLTEYSCEVKDVFSGDDLVVFVNLQTEDLWLKKRIRLYGVDTPNAVSAADDTEAGKIRRMVKQLVRGKPGRLTVISKSMTSWVCNLLVETPSGMLDVNAHLRGLGYVFDRKNLKP